MKKKYLLLMWLMMFMISLSICARADETEYRLTAPRNVPIGAIDWMYVDRSDLSDPWDSRCTLTDAEIVSETLKYGGSGHVLSMEISDDGNDLPICIVKGEQAGYAKIRISYLDHDGNNCAEETTVFVFPAYFSFTLNAEDMGEFALAGKPITLTSEVISPDGAAIAEDYTYLWDVEDSSGEYASVFPDEEDKTKAQVIFDPFSGEDEIRRATVRLRIGEMIDGDFFVIASNSIELEAKAAYKELYIEGLPDDMPIGATARVRAELRCYSSDGYEVAANAVYSWSDGVEAQETETPGEYVITRTSLGRGKLTATIPGDESSETYEINLQLTPTRVMVIIQGDPDLGYTAAAGRDSVFTGTVQGMESGLGDFEFVVTPLNNNGDPTGVFTEGVEYDADGRSVTIHGDALAGLKETYFSIHAVLRYEGKKLAETEDFFWFTKPINIKETFATVADANYTGKACTPAVEVRYNRVLEEGVDYTLKYSNNIKADQGVVTVTGIGEFTGSIDWYFVIKCKAPVLSDISNTANGVKLTWKKPDGAVGYRVFRKNSAGNWVKLADTKGLSYVDKTAVSGKAYTYTVRCITSDGGKYTSAYDTKGMTITYVAPPAISSVTNTGSGVKISWGKAAGAAKYRVFRKTGNSGWKKAGDTSSAAYTDIKAENGATYSYTVRCITSDGRGYTSAYDTNGRQITYVQRPVLNSAVSLNKKQMLVKWGTNAKATGYLIQYSTSSTFASGNKNVVVTGASSASRTITGLTTGKKYYVRIRAYRAVGGRNWYSAWSAAKGVTVK